jgi:hypothetical protein
VTDRFEKNIAGALKSVVDAHGPIDRASIPSAAKRIASGIRDSIKRERDILIRSEPKGR